MDLSGTRTSGSFGRRIRELRSGAGLTQQDLARRAGVSVGAIRDLEQGRVRHPHPEAALRIAQALGIDQARWDAIGSAVRADGGAESMQAGARAGLWIGALGPLLVVRNGVELRARPSGERAVLGLLAIAEGGPVRLDVVIDVLWHGDPPATAPAIVQTYISRLRQVLGRTMDDGAERLTRDGAGYRLNLADHELDLAVFRRLCADARAAWATGDMDRASETYDRLLRLWRGEPLPDVDVLHGAPAIRGLTQAWAEAILEYADAASATGRHGGVLPHLRTLAAREPLDEAVHARLMIALAGTGRQGEALGIYETLRRRLDQQLGVYPGPMLQDAHGRILRQGVRAPAVNPAGGWLPLFQLPAAQADFTGRAAESSRLISTITRVDQPGVPVAVLVGPPGAGKTTLALHVAHTLRTQFVDGQLWAYLAGTTGRPRDPGEILGEFLRALGLHGSGIPLDLSERAVVYRSRLAGRKFLVVVDDAATAEQVRSLIPGTPGCAVLVTSRTPLDGLDGAHLLPLDMMTDADATELLTRIVGANRVSAEPEAARDLVRVCGTLPLAVRIAGTKLAARPSWPLSLLARRITGAHARLSELESGNLSVRASIESSYMTLPGRSRRAFCLLALLGPADFAGWVVGVLIGEPDGDDVISDLESRSLVTVLGADATGEPRYRLHDLVRDFAAERLNEEVSGERHESLGRLLDAWLQLAVTADARLPAEPFFPPPAKGPAPTVVPPAVAERLSTDPLAWFTSERVNLLAAVEQACVAGLLDLASRLASHQRTFQHLQYRQDDAERMWLKVAGYASAADDHATAHFARLRVAASMVMSGQASNAMDILDQCIEELGQGPDPETLAIVLSWRANCAWDLDDFELARRDAARGVALARRAGSRLAEHRNLGFLGLALAQLGRPDEAMVVSEQGLAVASTLHEPLYEIESLGSHAFTCTLNGRHDRAIEVCQRGIELSRRVHDIGHEALFGGVLGDAYYATGRYAEAVDTWRGSLTVFRDHGSQRFHAVCLLKLGYAHQAMGSTEAVGYLAESLCMFRQLDLPHYIERAEQALENCRAQLNPVLRDFTANIGLASVCGKSVASRP